MSDRVLDSSVIIAIANNERYDAALIGSLEGAAMSAVNFAEVITRLIDLGIDTSSPRVQDAFSLLGVIEPFTETQAQLAGELRRLGKNVALGDRACMALGIESGAEVFTTDSEWLGFDLDVPVRLIREFIPRPAAQSSSKE